MNRQLQRTNEWRHYKKRIENRYGNVEITDNGNSWSIDIVTYSIGSPYPKYQHLWHGARLSDALK